MSVDFWSSYCSGAIGILIGNRLDIWKTELQAGNRYFMSSQVLDHSEPSKFRALTSLLRGAAAPVVGYGALNSILFMTYNRTLRVLDPSIFNYNKLAGVDLGKIWIAGAVGGLACWVISAPSEVIKCRAQLMVDGQRSSYATAADVWKRSGLRGFYLGGAITSVRDSLGYAWYFWSYELTKRLISKQPDPFADSSASEVLMAGGIAGVITWAAIYPLDMVKTKIQVQSNNVSEVGPLINSNDQRSSKTSWTIAKDIVRTEGIVGLYRGLAVCSLRAFIVNAVQFYVYETAMKYLRTPLNIN